MTKYNFGCGPRPLQGYVNIDGIAWPDVPIDYIWDLSDVPYPFAASDSAEEIISIECLEHLSHKDIQKVLKEWYRILKPGGVLILQVPDCGKMMEYYFRNQICECVPHKDPTNEFLAKVDCEFCHGNAKVNPIRWLFAFTGAQKHPYDTHKMIFTKDSLWKEIVFAGFDRKTIEFIEDINKLKVRAYKI